MIEKSRIKVGIIDFVEKWRFGDISDLVINHVIYSILIGEE